jgi:hypothetical protein
MSPEERNRKYEACTLSISPCTHLYHNLRGTRMHMYTPEHYLEVICLRCRFLHILACTNARVGMVETGDRGSGGEVVG